MDGWGDFDKVLTPLKDLGHEVDDAARNLLDLQEGDDAEAVERHPSRVVAILVCSVRADAGPAATFQVRCLDLNDAGLRFLHAGYLHPGVECVLTLVTRHRTGVRCAGKVTRCDHVQGKLHDVDVEFTETADLSTILPDADEPEARAAG